VPYHEIDFKKLTPKKIGRAEVVDIGISDFEKIVADKQSALIFIDQGGCVTAERMRGFIDKISSEEGLKFYKMMWADAKETSLKENVPYYPSLVIMKDGKVVKALRANSDEDGPIYNDKKLLQEWISKYAII